MKKNSEKRRLKKKVRGLGASFFLLAIPVAILVSIFLLSLILYFVGRSSYQQWENDFNRTYLNEDLVTIPEKESEYITTAIEEFKNSNNQVDFIEIPAKEFVELLAININRNVPSRINISKAHIEPEIGFWKIYLYTEVKGLGNAWLYFDLNKDSVESTDIYITDVKLGNISIRDWGGDGLVININEGIKDAMVLITQQDFTGRVIRNIELDEKNIIIKGER